jgi:hypothetical protein
MVELVGWINYCPFGYIVSLIKYEIEIKDHKIRWERENFSGDNMRDFLAFDLVI